MIISRTPFRISFAGGGTDLRAVYSQEPGMVLSTSINKYMFISIHPYFFPEKTLIKYSRTELVEAITDIQHPIVREVLEEFGVSGVDINSVADIPSGTGLGSSSSFTVGLILAVAVYAERYASKEYLADFASTIEIDRLNEPIGKQDQYAAAYGGLNFITFYPDERVTVEKVNIAPQYLRQLEDNLLLFYTGDTRSAKDILSEQKKNSESGKKKKNTARLSHLATVLREELAMNNIDAMGEILHESWMYKKEMASKISNPRIDHYYSLAMKAGASGGKLLGAGGGGFLLFYVPEEKRETVRRELHELNEMNFEFDKSGSVIIYNN
jgi:D-glycero-alpha-D-manno-heptose-7-phosphate kinase